MAVDSASTLDTRAAQAGGSMPKDPIDKIIVAIHGIGSQSRSSTIRTVASRFIWHRYIRQSVAIDTFRQWQKKHDAVPNAMMGLGRRRPAAMRQAP